MLVTIEQVRGMVPNNKEPDLWHSYANDFFPKYGITTINRIAGFFAQAGHESLDFTVLIENLNYSWQRLRVIFPRYYPTDAVAQLHHRNPQLIANHVYNDANRVSKLGNTQAGDGYRFRGRGVFQLTGRYNYSEFGRAVGMLPEEAAAYCSTKRGAFESACWYWQRNSLSRYTDADDIVGLSRAVNGGDIGLADRQARYTRAKSLLASTVTSTAPYRQLQKGSRDNDVKALQGALQLSADGIYGAMTEAAVRSWQRSNNQPVTGRVTAEQYSKIVGTA